MRSLLVFFPLLGCSALILAVDETCVERAFGQLLNADQIQALTTAFTSNNRKRAVENFVQSLHVDNSTQKKDVQKMCDLFQKRLAFVETLAKNFFKSLKSTLSDEQMSQLHDQFVASQKTYNCDVARIFAALYQYLSNEFSSNPTIQQQALTAANQVLQRFKKSNQTLLKLVKNMNFFLTLNKQS